MNTKGDIFFIILVFLFIMYATLNIGYCGASDIRHELKNINKTLKEQNEILKGDYNIAAITPYPDKESWLKDINKILNNKE